MSLYPYCCPNKPVQDLMADSHQYSLDSLAVINDEHEQLRSLYVLTSPAPPTDQYIAADTADRITHSIMVRVIGE